MTNTRIATGPVAPVETPTGAAAVPPDNKRKRDKVRSAWISFVGRILAQVIGATASVMLGIIVVQHYAAAAHSSDHAAEVTVPRERSGPGQLAIAVLPLDNFSGDASQEHLANGLTEALIADLSQARHVRVISRTSAMRYKGERKSMTTIARELGADMVVEGSIVRSGDRVRVTAQLIDGGTDEHVWARSFDRAVGDVLDAEAALASQIADQLIDSLPGKRAQ